MKEVRPLPGCMELESWRGAGSVWSTCVLSSSLCSSSCTTQSTSLQRSLEEEEAVGGWRSFYSPCSYTHPWRGGRGGRRRREGAPEEGSLSSLLPRAPGRPPSARWAPRRCSVLVLTDPGGRRALPPPPRRPPSGAPPPGSSTGWGPSPSSPGRWPGCPPAPTDCGP